MDHKFCPLAFSLIVFAGCMPVASEDVETSQIWAVAGVSERGDGAAEISLQLRTSWRSTSGRIELSDDESVIVGHAGTEVVCEQTRFLGLTGCSVALNETPGESFSIALHRPAHDDATGTEISLPGDFVVDELPADVAFSRADDLVVSWRSDSDVGEFNVSIVASCIDGSQNVSVAGDEREAVFTGGTMPTQPPSGLSEPVEDCEATVRVSRSIDGRLDEIFDGGTATGRRERSFTFQSVP